MPGVTVEELWRLAFPPSTSLVAGEGGLGREVSWPALLRSRPPAFDPLHGGEVALISLQAARLLDERLTLPRLMRSLTEMGVAAVAVAGEVDEESKQMAEKLDVPLFALPPGSNMHRVEQSVTRAVIDRRSELYQRSQEIYQQLTELVIAGRGVPAIVERLAEFTGRTVALEDDTLCLRVYSPQSSRAPLRDQLARAFEEAKAEIVAWIGSVTPSASDPPTARFDLPSLPASRLVAPVVSRDKTAGFLSIIGSNSELGELERMAVSRGAAACAIELVKEWAVLEAEDRLQVDLIDDLLNGDFTSTEALQNRAKRLGFDMNRQYGVLAFQLDPSISGSQEARGAAIRKVALDKLIEREIANRGVPALVGAKGEIVSVLYPLATSDSQQLKGVVAELSRVVALHTAGSLSAGIGCFHPGLEGMRLGFREAQQALAMGVRIFGSGTTTYFGDLGLYRLLFGIKDTRELQAFFDETLARLAAYDGRSDGELVKTLEAYFACHGSPTDAARKLHLHRNTLLYRLRRIQEIGGLDLEDAETRLSLHLALRVKDVLRAMPTK